MGGHTGKMAMYPLFSYRSRVYTWGLLRNYTIIHSEEFFLNSYCVIGLGHFGIFFLKRVLFFDRTHLLL